MTGKHHQKVKSVGQWHGEPGAQSGSNRPDRRQGVMGQATEPGLISAAGPSREHFVTYVSKMCDLETMPQHVRSTGVVQHDLSIKEGEDYNYFVLQVTLEDSDKEKDPAL